MRNILSTLLAIALGASAAASEAFRFANAISDNAVLQRDIEAPVWGFGDPGKTVSVSLNGKTVGQTTVAKDGRWIVKLPAQKANGNPSTIAAMCDGESHTITNILFGDVWFGCGQSNMTFMFSSFGWKAEGASNFVAQANKADIRILLMDCPNTGFVQKDAPCVRWKCSDPNDRTSVANFGAALYWMGDTLESELGVPIGLVNAAWYDLPLDWNVVNGENLPLGVFKRISKP